MSQESLHQLLERLNSDESFRKSLEADPKTALEGFRLTTTELTAILANDEEGLRRLTGDDVSGHSMFAMYRPLSYARIVYSCSHPCGSTMRSTGEFVQPC